MLGMLLVLEELVLGWGLTIVAAVATEEDDVLGSELFFFLISLGTAAVAFSSASFVTCAF